MKKTGWFLLILILGWAGCKFPFFGKKAPDSQAQRFEVSGLPVVLDSFPKEIVSVRLLIRGGTHNYLEKLEGLEHLALLNAVEGGSVLYKPGEYQSRLRAYGATVSARAGIDYSEITLRCPREQFGFSWALFAQAVLNPSFDEEFFEQTRRREIFLRDREESPAQKNWRMAWEDWLGQHDYTKQPLGTRTSLEEFGSKEAGEYFRALMGKARISLVVSGQLSRPEVEEKIRQTLAELQPGYYEEASIEIPRIDQSNLKTLQEGTESDIIGYFAAPVRGSREGLALQAGFAWLNSAMGENVAGLLPFRNGCGYFRLRGADFNNKAAVLVQNLRLLYNEGPPAEELERIVHIFKTRQLLREEAAVSRTFALAEAEVLGGNPPSQIIPILEKIRSSQVKKAFKSHCGQVSWFYFGSLRNLDRNQWLKTYE